MTEETINCWACYTELQNEQKKCHKCGEWQGKSQRLKSYVTRLTIIVSLVGLLTGIMGFIYTTRKEVQRSQAQEMQWLFIAGKGISFGRDTNNKPVS